jgi:hypothetical protein
LPLALRQDQLQAIRPHPGPGRENRNLDLLPINRQPLIEARSAGLDHATGGLLRVQQEIGAARRPFSKTPAPRGFQIVYERRTQMKKTVLWLMGMMLLVGCATTEATKTGTAPAAKAGFLGDYYQRLAPGPEGGAKMRWLKPGVDFAQYKRVMLDSVVFFFADESEYKGMDPQELKEIADAANRQLVDALWEKYPIVADPGPDVVRIRFAITDLKQSRPVLSGITSVVPIGIGISLVKKGATGSWTGSGATSAEVMVLDSTTQEVIGVAQDERSAGFTERFSKWGSTEDAFKFWAERLKLFLDSARAPK